MEINPTSVKRPFNNSYVILPSELSVGFPPAFSKETSLEFEREGKKNNKNLRVCSFYVFFELVIKGRFF